MPLLGNSISALGSPLVWPALLFGVRPGWNAVSSPSRPPRGGRRVPVAPGSRAVAPGCGPRRSRLLALRLLHRVARAPSDAHGGGGSLLLLFGGRLAERPTRGDFAGLVAATFVVLSGGHPETALLAALLAAAYAAFRGRTLAAPSLAGRRRVSSERARRSAAPSLPRVLRFERRKARGRTAPFRPASRRPPSASSCPTTRLTSDRGGRGRVSSSSCSSCRSACAVPRRDPERRFWAGAAVALLAIAYGGPLARALAERHEPVRFPRAAPLPLALGFLAAAGLDDLSRGPRSGRGGSAGARGGRAARRPRGDSSSSSSPVASTPSRRIPSSLPSRRSSRA